MKRIKRNYSNEFKQEAVWLSYPLDSIKELGIAVASKYNWKTLS